MKKLRIKRCYYILGNILLILFFSYKLFNYYGFKTSKKINLISEEYFQKEIYESLNTMVYDLSNGNLVDNILEIYKNNDQEILYVDYNLKKSYELLNQTTKILKEKINKNDYLEYELPFLIGSNNVFLSNLGPKVKIQIQYINSILTNLKTKITNYGMNNALVEAYIQITIEGKIITPVSSERKKVNYDFLISSKVINGRIPEFYGNYITSDSSIFDIPIN